jgi:hypothetical protein
LLFVAVVAVVAVYESILFRVASVFFIRAL